MKKTEVSKRFKRLIEENRTSFKNTLPSAVMSVSSARHFSVPLSTYVALKKLTANPDDRSG